MRAGDHRIGTGLQRVRRHTRVEPEVRRPGGVDNERHAVAVSDVSEPRDVAHRAHIGRITNEDGLRVRVLRQRRRDCAWRHRQRQE